MKEFVHYIDVLVLLLALLSLAGLGALVYLKNRSSLTNRNFMIVTVLLFIWTLATLFRLLNTDPGQVLFTFRLTHFLGTLSAAFIFYAALVFPGERDLRTIWKIVIFVPGAAIALVGLFSGLMIKDFIIADRAYLYAGQMIGGPWHNYYLIELAGSLLLAFLVLAVRVARRTGVERTKLTIVAAALSIGAVAVLLFSLLLPRLGISIFDALGPGSLTISMMFFAYAILRYGLFGITPQLAAAEILGVLGGAVVVSDLNGRVILAGDKKFTIGAQEMGRIVNKVAAQGYLSGYRSVIGDKPVMVSARFFGQGGCVVMVFHDITELEAAAEEERNAYHELAARLARQKALRESLVKLASALSPEEIDRSLAAAGQLLGDDRAALRLIESLAGRAQEKRGLLAQIEADKKLLEPKLAEIELRHREGVQRELEMIELKERIRELKEAKGL